MKRKVLTTTLLLSILFINLQSYAQCNINDWEALKAFYENTDGDNWKDNSGWEIVKENMPPEKCDLGKLNGVKLNTNGRVTHLELKENDLAGNIATELGNLTNLESLNLENNQLNGSLPTELGNLTNLKWLDLENNLLNNSIPAELGNLINLEKLNLFGNQLNGSIPKELGNLKNLMRLSLSANELSGKVPDELGDLKNLKRLFLNKNQLTGNIPSKLGNLSKLEELNMHTNKLIGSIPAKLGNLINLKNLTLPYNQLSGKIPVELGNLSNLENLMLSSNQLSGSIPSELGNLTKLEGLNLSDNQLNGSIPAELGNLSKLRDLTLNYNQLNGSIPSELGNLRKLWYLRLNDNQLSRTIPIEIGNLFNLFVLRLANNQLSGVIPFQFNNLFVLNILTIDNNKLSGAIPTELGSYGYLNFFSIYNNYFSCEEIGNTPIPNINYIDYPGVLTGFIYSPQYYSPKNYDAIKTNIFDTLYIDRSLTLQADFPFDTIGLTFQWFLNGDTVSDASQATFHIENINPNNVGKYTLHVQSENCLPDENTFEAISEPMYVILKGYDLLGQPVEYTQLMVKYENKEDKEKYEDEIFTPNGGFLVDKCDCNRGLYLYDFINDTSKIEQAYVALDKKIDRGKIRNEVDGGFNYKLNNIGLNFLSTSKQPASYLTEEELCQTQDAYTVTYNYPTDVYNDDVMIYLLDSGLDEDNFSSAKNYLISNAPIDSCYNLNAAGYNYALPNMNDYTEIIDTNYIDNVGHGTYGFRSISEGLEEAAKAKIVPIKIIEKATDGNLFDLICGIYHAVDHNASVINISAGYRGQSSGILANAIYEAREKGIFVVAAAGNDSDNIDDPELVPQYPAYYASQYHHFYKSGLSGKLELDSVPYDNLISVVAINANNKLNQYSNYGKLSGTIAAPGENIYGQGLDGVETVGTGTSIAAFLTTQVLAHEIALNNTRTLQEIWTDFESKYLVDNPNLRDVTSTGKQLDFSWDKIEISGCTDCDACNYFSYASIDDGSCKYDDCVTDIEIYPEVENSFHINPNPSNGRVTLELKGNANVGLNYINIFDLTGKTLYKNQFRGKKVAIDLNNIKKGIYLVEMKNTNQRSIQKLLME